MTKNNNKAEMYGVRYVFSKLLWIFTPLLCVVSKVVNDSEAADTNATVLRAFTPCRP